jgi:phage-related protein
VLPLIFELSSPNIIKKNSKVVERNIGVVQKILAYLKSSAWSLRYDEHIARSGSGFAPLVS